MLLTILAIFSSLVTLLVAFFLVQKLEKNSSEILELKSEEKAKVLGVKSELDNMQYLLKQDFKDLGNRIEYLEKRTDSVRSRVEQLEDYYCRQYTIERPGYVGKKKRRKKV